MPSTFATTQVDALERERAERPGAIAPASSSGSQPGAGGRLARTRRRSRAACAIGLRLGDALDLEAEQVGRGLVERLLDRELERGRRGRAAVAVADQLEVRDAVLEPQQLHVAAVRLHVRAHARERLLDARLERHRVEVVDQHQAADHAVAREPEEQPFLSLLRQLADDAREPFAVQLDDRRDELVDHAADERIGRRVDGGGQLLDPLEQRLPVGRLVPWCLDCHLGRPQLRPVGRWTTLRTRPAPVYMCTPHGRHGSNERTARMMSMPLKFSGPFSSKIGVFCTASS